MSTTPPPGTGAAVSDEAKLHELGYAQELKRGMSGFSNFAVSFTIISILSGCLTLFAFGMNTGGPMTMIWGWLLVGVFVVLVGLGMAEVCSSYPTAGGLYYWSAKLAKKNSALWSWFTGWFNLLGQVAVTAGIDFGCAVFATGFLEYTNALSANVGAHTTQHEVVLITALLLAIHGLLNSFGVNLVAKLANLSVWWHLVGVAIIVAVLAFAPAHHASASFVFTTFVNNTGFNKFPFYVFLIGLLNAQYTLTGYDASAHMTEETHRADVAGPRGIVMSIVVSIVAGWILLVGVSFAIQPGKYASEAGALVAPGQIFVDALGKGGGLFLLLIAIVAQFFCGLSSVTANSRMIYAFSRDGAVPGHRTWHKINPRTRTPTNAIWFATVGAFILVIPYWFNSAAYAAVTSIAVIGLYIAYIIPVFLRVRAGGDFNAGPWNLGRWGVLNGVVATAWTVFICIMLLLPQLSPITISTFNYAPVAVLVVIGFATIYWLVSARHWFTGPKVQGTAAELAAIERELKLEEVAEAQHLNEMRHHPIETIEHDIREHDAREHPDQE
jgi:amino acid permease (GABA permease)